MISGHYYKNIRLDITTYTKKKEITMNHEKSHPKHIANRIICSICLNRKHKNDDSRRPAKSCPICFTEFTVEGSENDKKNNITKTKSVQTSETDITHGITLLNEVLNVFQSKKNLDATAKTHSRDASVNTTKKNLVKSDIFHYSIEDDTHINSEGKFTVINNCEPQKMVATLTLSKHKSSSIPQMKLEELKHSLKEKTKSKDAIEEVNRMFANVRKFNLDNDSNRPVIRNGPRILPVVKTAAYIDDTRKKYCQCCQDVQMSSGDSGLHGCTTEKCAECLYMCCHYQHYKCEDCQKFKPDESHCRERL